MAAGKVPRRELKLILQKGKLQVLYRGFPLFALSRASFFITTALHFFYFRNLLAHALAPTPLFIDEGVD